MSSLISGVQAAWEAIETAAGYTENATGYQGVIGKAARLTCDAYARNPARAWTTSIGLGLVLDRGCEAYLSTTGSMPSNNPPYPGGQCPVPYNFDFTVTQPPAGGAPPTTGSAFVGDGPISGLVRSSAPAPGGFTEYSWFVTNGLGQSVPVFSNVYSVEPQLTGTPVRLDGLPDNCGDQVERTPTNPPAGPGEYGNTYNVEIAGGGNVDVTINFPSVNIDGDGNIAIDIGGETVNTGPGEPDTCGPDGFTPDGSGPTSPTGTEGEEEAEQQTVIVGLRTTITTDIVDGSTYPIASGVLRIPRIGWVQFREPQSQQWSDAISIRVKPSQFTACPWAWGADRVRWRYYDGVQGNAQAITKTIDKE